MHSVLARRLALQPPGIHLALWRFADECNGFLARLMGYMGALALIAMIVVCLCGQLQVTGSEAAARSGWIGSARPAPDSFGKAETYEFRWALRGNTPVAEAESSRPVSLLGLRGSL
jgi:hypothetical protein